MTPGAARCLNKPLSGFRGETTSENSLRAIREADSITPALAIPSLAAVAKRSPPPPTLPRLIEATAEVREEIEIGAGGVGGSSAEVLDCTAPPPVAATKACSR